MTSDKVWIYALVDPRTDVIRYVGSTLNPDQRFAKHRSNSHSRAVRKWIRELTAEGLEPYLHILDKCPRNMRGRTERRYIRLYQVTLLNNIHAGTSADEVFDLELVNRGVHKFVMA